MPAEQYGLPWNRNDLVCLRDTVETHRIEFEVDVMAARDKRALRPTSLLVVDNSHSPKAD